MDWSDTVEQATFRTEVRDLISSRLPERYRAMAASGDGGIGSWQGDRVSENEAHRKDAADWAQALSEKGWVAPHWPEEYGGASMGAMEQFIFNQEMAEAGAPSVGGSGVGLLGPALIVHGTEEQKARYLPPILAGEKTWAQGFSEPAAGSDLAGL